MKMNTMIIQIQHDDDDYLQNGSKEFIGRTT